MNYIDIECKKCQWKNYISMLYIVRRLSLQNSQNIYADISYGDVIYFQIQLTFFNQLISDNDNLR